MLREAGFEGVQVIDSGKDLNAYAKVEGGEGCCPPAPDSSGSCCVATSEAAPDLHKGLAQLLTRFDVNEYAASVRVFAVKS
jgi:hypothetical protein